MKKSFKNLQHVIVVLNAKKKQKNWFNNDHFDLQKIKWNYMMMILSDFSEIEGTMGRLLY